MRNEKYTSNFQRRLADGFPSLPIWEASAAARCCGTQIHADHKLQKGLQEKAGSPDLRHKQTHNCKERIATKQWSAHYAPSQRRCSSCGHRVLLVANVSTGIIVAPTPHRATYIICEACDTNPSSAISSSAANSGLRIALRWDTGYVQRGRTAQARARRATLKYMHKPAPKRTLYA